MKIVETLACEISSLTESMQMQALMYMDWVRGGSGIWRCDVYKYENCHRFPAAMIYLMVCHIRCIEQSCKYPGCHVCSLQMPAHKYKYI